MITRRAFLLLGVVGTAHAQLPPNIGEIRKKALDEAIRQVVGSNPVRQGRVKLDLPPLIDNGNTVPLSAATVVKVRSGLAAIAGWKSARNTSTPL